MLSSERQRIASSSRLSLQKISPLVTKVGDPTLTFLLLTAFLKHRGDARSHSSRLGPDLLQSRPKGFALKARVDNYFRSKPLEPVAQRLLHLWRSCKSERINYSLGHQHFALDCHDAQEGNST